MLFVLSVKENKDGDNSIWFEKNLSTHLNEPQHFWFLLKKETRPYYKKSLSPL